MEETILKTNNCNNCVHLKVCSFRGDKINLIYKLDEVLKNEAAAKDPHLFECNFWCKQYMDRKERIAF